MMDYTKEIERLHKAQQKAAAAPPAEFSTDAFADMSPDTHDTAPSTGAGVRPHGKPTDADLDSDLDELPSTSEPDVPVERVLAAGRQGISVGFLIPAAILLWFAWSGVDDAWDGYYLRPFQAMFVLVPLGMMLAILGLRHLLLQKLKFPQAGNMADIKLRISSTLRWAPKTVMALALVSFGSMFLMPRGLPVGQWLGLAAPVEAEATNAMTATEAVSDAVTEAAADAAKPGDSSAATPAPQSSGLVKQR